MSNRILIVALNENWPGISRLPSSLKRVGFQVFTLCPQKSFIAQSVQVHGTIKYPTFSYSRSKFFYLLFLFALIYFHPDLLIPGDEEALIVFHRMANFLSFIPGMGGIERLIRNSLSPKQFDPIIESKERFVEACREWKVSVPLSVSISTFSDAVKALKQLGGFPVVLKMDSGYGGSGVSVCENESELKNKIYEFGSSASLSTKIKNFIRRALFISVFDSGEGLSLQQFIKGQVGLAPFISVNGKLIAVNPMLKIETYPDKTSPSCVVQGLENLEIIDFSKRVAENLKYNGFGSLDFIIEEETGKCFVIELNARPVPTAHLKGDIVGNDLCHLLFQSLNQKMIEINKFKSFVVALFPNELKRDPQSKYFQSGFHDIPTDEPLIKERLLK